MTAMFSSIGTQMLQAITPKTSVRADRSRCVRHRCKRNECRECLDVCPSGAIAWGEQGLHISSELCTQCLRCLSVCPTAALHSPEMSLLQVLSDLAAHPNPVLGCDHQSATAHARFPCLGCLADPELMLLLALVFSDGLQVNLTCCRECPNGHVVTGIQAAWASLSEIRPENRIRLVGEKETLDYRPLSLSRRELFGFFRNRSKRAAMVMIERLQGEAGDQSYGSKQVPQARILLLRAMESLPETEQHRISDLMFGQISFTSTCTSCGGCAGVCPTGAIEPAGEFGQPVGFDRGRCVGCGSCQAFCRKQGVQLSAISKIEVITSPLTAKKGDPSCSDSEHRN